MNKKDFIKELKNTRKQIAPCLVNKDKDRFIGEFDRKELKILDRALLIAIQVTDLDVKGR